ncbi:DUF6650 family protein [Tistlia consotensis]|uniref:DUF6650 family protein n=1 Tax=Tistlia consotensis TaxID=1321365 RepID=UPI000A164129|nr:DUF6650 family protein [Tistlia consotensis]
MKKTMKRARRITAETARRITGVSTPLGGIQWADPGPSQREHIRKFIVALEDRRVLYNPMWIEDRGQVDRSILEIRFACSQTLQQLPEDDFAVTPLRMIRAACRRYHDDSSLDFHLIGLPSRSRGTTGGFFVALGQFRATIAFQVALLAAHYGFDIEGDLAGVLPALDDSVQEQ